MTCQIKHLYNVPALAYIAAGKLHRKHILFGAPGGALAACIVEAHKFFYVYKSTGIADEYGRQEVKEMYLYFICCVCWLYFLLYALTVHTGSHEHPLGFYPFYAFSVLQFHVFLEIA